MDTPIVPRDTGFNNTVYEPAEDSFLLLDALEQDLSNFVSSRDCGDNAILALEVGCGSGIISTAVAKSDLLAPRLSCVFAADVNPHACLLTQRTAEVNQILDNRVQPLLLNGATDAWKCFRQPFDLIVCNPPYVPVLPGENLEDGLAGILEQSWSGGPDGNQFIVPFLTNIGRILAEDGMLYLLLSSWNNPEMLVDKVAKPNGLRGDLVLRRVAGRERLSVWRFSKLKEAE